MCYYDPKNFFLEKYQYGYQKNAEFYADFKFVDADLKGQCHEIFCFWFFSWISFPPAPEYPIRTVSNFFENSRRYSQVKVHHRYQRHRWQICHRCQRHRRQTLPPVWLVLLTPVANLPPVSKTPAANLPPVSTTLAKMVEKFAIGVADTGGKFATSVVDTGGNFATSVVDTGGAPWLTNISANFRKNSKRSKGYTLGRGETDLWKKPEAKNLVTLSL